MEVEETYRQIVKREILNPDTFVRAIFSGRQRGQTCRWRRVIVRPVVLKTLRHLQVSHFDERKDITQNYAGPEADAKVDELLSLPFRHIALQTTLAQIEVQISNSGNAHLARHPVTEARPPSLAHDREKPMLLTLGEPDSFLHAIGITSPDGKIRADMYRKYRQINEFLRLIVETRELERIERDPITIVDCGCGSAYLTFAVYHYIQNILRRPVQMMGIDVNAALMDKHTQLVRDLGWEGLAFHSTSIIDFQPAVHPDIVIALHACDTATDEALAQAVAWRSRMIFSAPCCHHHLQQQMSEQPMPEIYHPVLRHGILKDRLGDLLTDGFRAQLLRIMGYRTDVVEFISAEHTDKNLMIRAVQVSAPGDRQAIAEYLALRSYWNVLPYLERLLSKSAPDFDHWLNLPAPGGPPPR